MGRTPRYFATRQTTGLTLASAQELNRADRLRVAADEVARVVATLDSRMETCETCHRQHYRDQAAAKVYERLGEIPSRLRSIADTLQELDGKPAEAVR